MAGTNRAWFSKLLWLRCYAGIDYWKRLVVGSAWLVFNVSGYINNWNSLLLPAVSLEPTGSGFCYCCGGTPRSKPFQDWHNPNDEAGAKILSLSNGFSFYADRPRQESLRQKLILEGGESKLYFVLARVGYLTCWTLTMSGVMPATRPNASKQSLDTIWHDGCQSLQRPR